ncbi:protein-tyrosine phosphatase [Enterococcus sp. AZ194]|uniref:tyrosine-protein phosphatase n=1 Tax=Enterococcus sp. AZ194 TaxID=2774629 RepID=UPI003F29EEE7
MERIIEIKNGKNFRDIGGYSGIDGKTVKVGKVIRSGDLTQLSNEDKMKLNQINIRHIIDLRSENEKDENPDRIPPGSQYHSYPIFDFTNQKKINPGEFISLYDELIFDQHAQATYYKIFKCLIEQGASDNALLYHCLGGKDRTGVVTILLLSILGVSESDILSDFLLTNEATKEFIESFMKDLEQSDVGELEMAQRLDEISVKEEYYYRAIDNMKSLAGNVDNYILENIGLTEEEISKLRELYLV